MRLATMRVMKNLALIVLVSIGLALFTAAASAGTAVITWIPPTTCADGSALTDCPTSGYEVSEGATATSTFAVRETVAAGVVTRSYTIPPGQRCFSLKTISNSLKSDESQRVCITMPSLPPKAPAGVTVTIAVTISTP